MRHCRIRKKTANNYHNNNKQDDNLEINFMNLNLVMCDVIEQGTDFHLI